MIAKLFERVSYAHLLAYNVILGLSAGLIIAGFIYALEQSRLLIWNTLPTALGLDTLYDWYVIAACTVGGLLLGLALKTLGDYPKSLEITLADYKKTKAFDYRHLWQAVLISLVSLGFGASLGPEAALATLIGGLITLAGVKLKHASLVAYGADINSKLTRPKRVLLGLAAASSAWLVFSNIGDNESYFDITTESYLFNFTDLAWMLLIIPAAVLVGWLYNRSEAQFDDWFADSRKQNIVLTATAGGLMLGLLGFIQPDILFSGHENLGWLLQSIAINGTWFFVGLVLAKIAATAICLTTGWKGGRFLPVLMMGAAAGLAVSTITPVSAMFAMAIGMAACLSFVLKKPLIAGLLVVLFFPLSLALQIMAAAFIARRIPNLRRSVSRVAS